MGSTVPSLDDDVAIIGMACRFPGDATSPSKLWDLLMDGKSAWSEVPASRWNWEAHYHPSQERAGSNIVKGGHFLRDGEQNGKQFDAAFFNITRTETETMDLQQRVVSRCCQDPAFSRVLGEISAHKRCFLYTSRSEKLTTQNLQWKMSTRQWRARASASRT